MSKLWTSGITGSLWSFFKAYFEGREQCVVIDSSVSQGSILGPPLFIMFINDLPSTLAHSLCYFFANDTKCCKSILSYSDSSLLQHYLNSLSCWSQDNHLSFNASKCSILHFINRAVSFMTCDLVMHSCSPPVAVMTWESSFPLTSPGSVTTMLSQRKPTRP